MFNRTALPILGLLALAAASSEQPACSHHQRINHRRRLDLRWPPIPKRYRTYVLVVALWAGGMLLCVYAPNSCPFQASIYTASLPLLDQSTYCGIPVKIGH